MPAITTTLPSYVKFVIISVLINFTYFVEFKRIRPEADCGSDRDDPWERSRVSAGFGRLP